MKGESAISRLVMLLVAATLTVYCGVSVWRGMTDPLTTAVAYGYTVNDSVETDALLVRREQVLSGQTGIVDVVPGEGERVGAGQTVATVYRDSAALERKDRIRSLSMEVELLEYATTRGDNGTGSGELEQEVVRCAALLRSDTAAGDFGRLEDRVLDLKRAVLHRDYVYGQGVEAGRLAALNGELSALRSRSEQETTRLYAGQSGVYSAQVDGFETLIDPQSVFKLTSDELEGLLEQEPVVGGEPIGKLITSNRWGLVLALSATRAEKLVPGHELAVRFTGDFEKDVPMRIDSVSKPEGDKCVVVLTTDRYLSSTTLLRRQTVEVIFRQDEGIRVPKESVHILTETATDESGKQTETRRTGVYAVINNRAEFKNVQVLAQGSQFYVVKPLDEGKMALRAGDEIVVRGKNIRHGSVVIE